MKLDRRLLLSFLGCGLIPLLLASGTLGWFSRAGMQSLQSVSIDSAKEIAKDDLVAIRDVKKRHLMDYFNGIRNQVIAWADNRVIIEATRDLKSAMQAMPNELRSAGQIDRMRQELSAYYSGDFNAAYRKQNNDVSVDTAPVVRQLDDLAVVAQHQYISGNVFPLGEKLKLERASGECRYNRLHAQLHPSLRRILEMFGYYDIFLVDGQSGRVVYTVFKELDFGTSLQDGPWAPTGLGEAYRRAMTAPAGEAVLTDFARYQPSYEAPASFLAVPVFDDGQRIGALVVQLPLDRINQMMANDGSMGETGETYLIGADRLPRSDSRLDPVNRNVVQAFRNPEKAYFKTGAADAIFDRQEAGVMENVDYVGEPSLTAYSPVEIMGLKWGLVAKRHQKEALARQGEIDAAAARSMSFQLWTTLAIAGITGLCVAAFGIFTARSIARPIVAAAQFAQQIASGNLVDECRATGTGEVGDLLTAMGTMRTSLRSMVSQLQSNAETLATSSNQLSSTATQLAGGAEEMTRESTGVSAAAEEMSANMTQVSSAAEEMSASVRSVAAAVEEMTASISEIAQNAENAATVAHQAQELTEASNRQVQELGRVANEIGKVIEVIQDIAEQTNLLALNATIEAARAGEAGKGFAVVATEVKELARQTGDATEDIRQRITGIQQSANQSATAISSIDEVIRNVNTVARTIASAVEQQRATTQEISQRICEASESAGSISESVAQSAAASSEITSNMVRVDSNARQTATGASQAKAAGNDLLGLSTQLHDLVTQFRL